MTNLDVWDVSPKNLRLSISEATQNIPLSIRSNDSSPVFETSDSSIAQVNQNGVVSAGMQAGGCIISIWKNAEKASVRHVGVEVRSGDWYTNHPDFRQLARVQMTGNVQNARNAQNIFGCRILVSRTSNSTVIQEVYTDIAGQFILEPLYEGIYAIEASSEGFITYHGLMTVSEAGSHSVSIMLSPILIGQVARIVLTWGATPSDLDSHLTGPLSTGGRFHVYYANANVANCGQLDIDDTSSYGPETITIFSFIPGIYKYCVHDYTNRSSGSSSALAQSGATVTVYLYDGTTQTFTVPNQPGTVWNVFEIDGSTSEIRVLNQMIFQSSPESVGL